MGITDINDKKFYIEFYYFGLINSNFYENKNLDKFFPYNGLEHDISILRNVGNIFLMVNFNARKRSNQANLLRNN